MGLTFCVYAMAIGISHRIRKFCYLIEVQCPIWIWNNLAFMLLPCDLHTVGPVGRVILGQLRGYKISNSLALSGQEEDNDHKVQGHRHQPL